MEEAFNYPTDRMIRNKKGQMSAGLITGLVFGIASLIIGTIIAFVIISTLNESNLLEDGRVTTTVTNETDAWCNQTGYSLDEIAADRLTYTITAMWSEDSGEYNLTMPVANYSVTAAGVVRNATILEQDNVSISYTYVTYTDEEYSAGLLAGNFSGGIDNVSSKIPTVLLVAAIVLILGVLALLVGVWQRMRLGGGSI